MTEFILWAIVVVKILTLVVWAVLIMYVVRLVKRAVR